MAGNILILGNSRLAVLCAAMLRKANSEDKIILASPEDTLPYDCSLIPELFAKKLNNNGLLVEGEQFFADQRIDVLKSIKPTSINLNKKRVYAEGREQVPFDQLLITDPFSYRDGNIKGMHREGVYRIAQKKDAEAFCVELPYLENIIIQSGNLSGLEIAWTLVQQQKEVILIAPHESIFHELTGAAYEWFHAFLEKKGIRIITGNPIIEVLGDQDVKAVKLSSGKVFATQAVLFESLNSDVRLLNDAGIESSTEGDLDFKTTFSEVFLAKEVYQSQGVWPRQYSSCREWIELRARSLTAQLGGQDFLAEKVVLRKTLKLGEDVIDLAGASFSESLESREFFSDQGDVLMKMFFEKGKAVAAFSINAGEGAEQTASLISQGKNIEDIDGFFREFAQKYKENSDIQDVPEQEAPVVALDKLDR